MKYNTGNYEKYMSKNLLKRKRIEKFNQRIIDIVKSSIDKDNYSILDAGCGEGFIDHLIFENFPKVRITGLEYTSEAIAVARKMNPFVEYIQGDVCNMKLMSDSFDLVICTEVLEHLSNPHMALHELERVSKDKILISVPNEPWFCLGNLLSLKNVSRLGNPTDHINHWTKNGFTTFLAKNSKRKAWIVRQSFPWTIAICSK